MKKGETEVLSGGRADETEFTGSVLPAAAAGDQQLLEQADRRAHRVDDDPTNNGKAVFRDLGHPLRGRVPRRRLTATRQVFPSEPGDCIA